MVDYVDVVVCKHDGDNKPYLFEAPAWSGLENADNVLVDTCNGEKQAVVQSVCTIRPGTEAWVCLLMAARATQPLRKVIGKIQLVKFEYSEDEA